MAFWKDSGSDVARREAGVALYLLPPRNNNISLEQERL